jgi:hypothetical protein
MRKAVPFIDSDDFGYTPQLLGSLGAQPVPIASYYGRVGVKSPHVV